MKIFIASSTESRDLLREVESWIQELDHEPWPWDKPGLFPPGEQTLLSLISISKQVDAAICIFGADDRIWYRKDTVAQPRDNVPIEYGLFVGALGPLKAIICTHGAPKISTDLHGITSVDLSGHRDRRGRMELIAWARRLKSTPVDPTQLRLMARVHELEQSLVTLSDRMAFEREKSADLESLLQKNNVVNFGDQTLDAEGYWKLLYNYRYFEGAARAFAATGSTPYDLHRVLSNANAQKVAEMLSYDSNPQSNVRIARKALRVFRQYSDLRSYKHFVDCAPPDLRDALSGLALQVISEPPNDEEPSG
jgi:Predicted nucleotide-binding protein containing TIR-like domain